MENEKASYWRRYDWDGDGDVDDKDAVVYLSRHVLIRLTDPHKDPVPRAKCRVIGDSSTIYECDEDGVAHIPVSDWNIKGLDLEWERGDAEKKTPESRYYWKNSFDLDVCDCNDPAISHRFNNLGFYGNVIDEQVAAYQQYFGRTPPYNLDNIKKEMADWHDGGTYPGQIVTQGTSAGNKQTGGAAQNASGSSADYSAFADDSDVDNENKTVEEKLTSTFAYSYFKELAGKMSEKEFIIWCANIFGYDIPESASKLLRNDLLGGSFKNPPIMLCESRISGHDGAYDQNENIIKIYKPVVNSAQTSDDDAWKTLAILVEEFGHHVDNRLRFQYSTVKGDADLDEGSRFAYLLIYWDVPNKTSMDIGVYHNNGQDVTLKVDYSGFSGAVERWLNEHEQDRDDRDIDNEYFGAGLGSGGCCSYAHERIELVLRDEIGFSDEQRRQIYFGNWMRDYSQIVDPFVLKRKFNMFNKEFSFTRKTLTRVVDYLARQHFGQKRDASGQRIYRVDEYRLGCYRPEEHIDNPCGLDPKGPDFGPFRQGSEPGAPELAIDANTWLKKYIATTGPWPITSMEFVENELDAAFAANMSPEGFRHLGAALHVLEDFYAHSNFIEVVLQRTYPKVVVWAKKMSNGHYPIVTGVFGSLDTIATLSFEITKFMIDGGECIPGKRAAGAELALILMEDIDKKWSENTDSAMKVMEDLGKEYPRASTFMCRTIGKAMKMIDLTLGTVIRFASDSIDDFQTKFGGFTANPENATHSQLSKDHDNHPLHEPAALCAVEIARAVGGAMKDAWEGFRSIDEVKDLARTFFVHPEHMDTSSSFNHHAKILSLIENWAKANPAEVDKASSATWVEYQCRRHKAYLEKAKEISKSVTGDDSTLTNIVDLLIRLGD